MVNNKMCTLHNLNNFINQRSSQEAKGYQASSAYFTTSRVKAIQYSTGSYAA